MDQVNEQIGRVAVRSKVTWLYVTSVTRDPTSAFQFDLKYLASSIFILN